MAGALSTASIITDAIRRADMENTEFIGSSGSPSERTQLLEQTWQELYARICARSEDVFRHSVAVQTVANQGYIYWPATGNVGMGSFRGLKYTEGPFLRKIDLKEIPIVAFRNQAGKPSHYDLSVSLFVSAPEVRPRIHLYPTPDAVYSLTLYYRPFIVSLATFVDTGFGYETQLDFLYPLRQYLVLSLAMKMKDKEESDQQSLLEEREVFWGYMEQAFSPMDAGEPANVVIHGSDRMPYPTEDPYGDEFFG